MLKTKHPKTLHGLLRFLRFNPLILRQDNRRFRFLHYRNGVVFLESLEVDAANMVLPIRLRGCWSEKGWTVLDDGFGFRRCSLHARFYFMEGIHAHADYR